MNVDMILVGLAMLNIVLSISHFLVAFFQRGEEKEIVSIAWAIWFMVLAIAVLQVKDMGA